MVVSQVGTDLTHGHNSRFIDQVAIGSVGESWLVVGCAGLHSLLCAAVIFTNTLHCF